MFQLTATDANKRNLIAATLVAFLFGLMMTFDAMAGTGGQAFDNMYTNLVGMADGSPGKILAFLTICGVLFFSVVRPNLIGLGASVIIMVVLSEMASIIGDMVTAGLPV
ncbi:hypothetical protein [Vibrio owensii]|uniref:hypothetical protein n=1 Tax=Vibrio owensii TaxID=696485 RepID=UPI00406910D7